MRGLEEALRDLGLAAPLGQAGQQVIEHRFLEILVRQRFERRARFLETAQVEKRLAARERPDRIRPRQFDHVIGGAQHQVVLAALPEEVDPRLPEGADGAIGDLQVAAAQPMTEAREFLGRRGRVVGAQPLDIAFVAPPQGIGTVFGFHDFVLASFSPRLRPAPARDAGRTLICDDDTTWPEPPKPRSGPERYRPV